MQISPHSAEGRCRAALEEESISFRPWDPSQPYPTSSLPALRAVRCAQLQGEEEFQRLHIALFKAFFEDSRNIADREVLLSLAEDVGLDVERFTSDFDQGLQESKVLAEYQDAKREYEGWGVPLAIIGDRYPAGGAVPIDIYRRAVDLCLATQAD